MILRAWFWTACLTDRLEVAARRLARTVVRR